MTRYLCKKCRFSTDKFSDMQRHLNKKKSCKKNLEAFNYSDDQLLILSLLHQSDDFEKIKEEILYLKNSNIEIVYNLNFSITRLLKQKVKIINLDQAHHLRFFQFIV